jgi:hypothetical protein
MPVVWCLACGTCQVCDALFDAYARCVVHCAMDNRHVCGICVQVAAAQALGLSGAGVRLCVIDGPIDIRHPTFGNCRSPGVPGPPECRVYTAYNADTKGDDVVRAAAAALHVHMCDDNGD